MASIDKLKDNLQTHLFENEKILATVQGSFAKDFFNSKIYKKGILSLTNKRILFYSKKIFGYIMESFPLENVSSIEFSSGLMGKEISFFATGNKAKLKWIQRGEVDLFIKKAQESIGSGSKNKELSENPIISDHQVKLSNPTKNIEEEPLDESVPPSNQSRLILTKRPWYHGMPFVITMLFLFSPIGAIFMWTGKRFPLWVRIPITGIIALFLVGLIVSPEEKTEQASQKIYNETTIPEEEAEPSEKAAKQNEANKFASNLKRKIGDYENLNYDIKMDYGSKNDVALHLYYKTMPSNLLQVKSDATFVAKKALATMTKSGVNPSDDMAFLFVHAKKMEKGETGKDLVRVFGRISYSFSDDQLEWEPGK
ncbi:MAG: hypothetical protein COX62_04530 [Deltaproteobacteria bacterium CG_4_10_14_0_2_um_filter_43_8]|nr:MAG: hypothetical protein COV43_04605 [Deltaproteobacteria bacterium CG11_big_fil_rev_8_21_14_0_20_42_23]PJA20511.1 MAG: hypothetical protein COX62_04530 [Deltaproteobacteria bacterium CG_4_10_14_0_2_um_filter_43_8]PJC65056.1 MAG: hypothetical protein CO021_00995 [Deltaproteobacteria bacterium CG_4_9_14_0_2_um_filter_42_21]